MWDVREREEMDDKTQSLNKKNDDEEVAERQEAKPPAAAAGGGWGFSPLSFLSDLQKAAAVAAEEISRNVRLETKCRFYFILFDCAPVHLLSNL